MLGGVIPVPAAADEFPSGPIEVINNSKPGGGSDIFLRFATKKAGEILGTDFIHLSKTGGIATNTPKYVAGKPADGQTRFIVNAGTALTMMRGKVDLTKDDIVPLARGTIDPNFVVVKAGRFADAAELIESVQGNSVTQAGTKVSGNPHVAALIFRNGLEMQDQVYVPFEKSGEIVINVINGNVDVALLNFDDFASQAEAGEVEAPAILTPERSANSPDVPTGHEVGMPVDIAVVRGIGVPKGTPAAAMTTFDGYPMAQKGEAGRALGIATFSSAIGGILGILVMIVATPLLARVAFHFGPAAFFALAVVGICGPLIAKALGAWREGQAGLLRGNDE